VFPKGAISELIFLGALDQSSREVDWGIVMREALGDWIKKKRTEQGLRESPLPWEK